MAKIYRFNQVTSTSDYLKKLINEDKASDRDIVTAAYQTQGRGQHGNSWFSDRDKNLLFSMMIKSGTLAAENQFMLSKTISLAIYDAFLMHHVDLKIKWPNDIYFKENKLGGILIENFFSGSLWDYSIAGIGLNINQESFPTNLPNPVSLYQITGKHYNNDEILVDLSQKIEIRLRQLFDRHFDEIDRDYEKHLLFFGENREFVTNSGELTGCISKVFSDGKIEITGTGHKKYYYYFKEIAFRF